MEKVEDVDGGQDSSSSLSGGASLPAEKSNGLTSVIKNKKIRRGYLPAFDNSIQRVTIRNGFDAVVVVWVSMINQVRKKPSTS